MLLGKAFESAHLTVVKAPFILHSLFDGLSRIIATNGFIDEVSLSLERKTKCKSMVHFVTSVVQYVISVVQIQ